jgi:radical SAM enzyme (TIGR04100 family)
MKVNKMAKAMTISYVVGDNLYLNLTNKCPCACTFCIRNHADGAYGSDPLWLEHEPDMDEIMADLRKRDLRKYREVVFCGYGEPTERLDVLLETAAYLRSREHCPRLRLNTNGLGDLIHGRSIAKELCYALDCISISLNAPTEEEYMKVTRPKFANAFEGLQKFTKDCVKANRAEIIMSVVDVITPEQIEASKKLAAKLGAKLRVRTFDE